MKKYSMLAIVLVLTASIFVGCGCTNQDMTNTVPTVLPTNEEVMPTTRATTAPTTAPTTEATAPTVTTETIDRGNGPIDDMTTTATTATESNARGIVGNGSAGHTMPRK